VRAKMSEKEELRREIETIIYENVEDGGIGTREATTLILKLIDEAKQEVFGKIDMEIGFLKRRYKKIPLKLELFFVDYEKLKEVKK